MSKDTERGVLTYWHKQSRDGGKYNPMDNLKRKVWRLEPDTFAERAQTRLFNRDNLSTGKEQS